MFRINQGTPMTPIIHNDVSEQVSLFHNVSAEILRRQQMVDEEAPQTRRQLLRRTQTWRYETVY